MSEVQAKNEMFKFKEVSERNKKMNSFIFIGSTVLYLLFSVCITLEFLAGNTIIIFPVIVGSLSFVLSMENMISASVVVALIVGLIGATFITLFLSTIFNVSKIETSTFNFNYFGLIIFLIVVVASFAYKKIVKKAISPILLILLSGVLGIIFYGLI